LKRIRLLLLLTASVVAGGCERAPEPEFPETYVEFGSGVVMIATRTDTFTVRVEVAETDQQRRIGLMRRPQLPEDSGMIFLFPEEQSAENVFWMFNTLIPLSIAFLDGEGRIGSIREMEPCPSPYPQYCPGYEAGVPFRAALEVNRGYFERRGIGVGDRVILQREGAGGAGG
jgi:uncharacterized protein